MAGDLLFVVYLVGRVQGFHLTMDKLNVYMRVALSYFLLSDK
jgi:hypothetical protein